MSVEEPWDDVLHEIDCSICRGKMTIGTAELYGVFACDRCCATVRHILTPHGIDWRSFEDWNPWLLYEFCRRVVERERKFDLLAVRPREPESNMRGCRFCSCAASCATMMPFPLFCKDCGRRISEIGKEMNSPPSLLPFVEHYLELLLRIYPDKVFPGSPPRSTG